MTFTADDAITALRTHHDDLATYAAGLDAEQLSGPSGAAEWTVAQVLSHLGSGSEIMLGTVTRALDPGAPETDNKTVWARWDALAPAEQAAAFVEHDERLVATLEGLDAAQRADLRLDLGFLPAPATLATALGMRLNEVAAHAWDAHLGTDPVAELDATSAGLLAEAFADQLSFLLGFVGKADRVAEPVRLAVPGWTVAIGDGVRVERGTDRPTAEFTGSLAAAVRLLTGRLRSGHTPADVRVTGNVGLEELRAVFPGF